MKVRVLGSAAGGGLPQWNCNCPNCRSARNENGAVRPRTQSSLAVSPDGKRWILVNASPDIRDQVNRTDTFHDVDEPRGTTIEEILLTDAEIDHASGLLFVREADSLNLRTTESVRHHLHEEFNLLPTLDAFTDCRWRELVLDEPFEPLDGLRVDPFPVAGSPPSYSSQDPSLGDTIGLELTSPSEDEHVLYLPALAELTDDLKERVRHGDLVLLDGSFWSDDEMGSVDEPDRRASDMGHLPVGGDSGSLEQFRKLNDTRKVYVHVNNTNPMLHPESEERRRVEEAGFTVGRDDMIFEVEEGDVHERTDD